jgi:hypothetical protein
MMLSRADFEELFPDIFSPAKVDPAQCEPGFGRCPGALSALHSPSPLLVVAGGPPPHLPNGPEQVEKISQNRVCQLKPGFA